MGNFPSVMPRQAWPGKSLCVQTRSPGGFLSPFSSWQTGVQYLITISSQRGTMPLLTLGDVTAKPGTIQRGRWEAFAHPTGGSEFLPVLIAQGRADGPCFWLTAGIHGPEHAGPLVIYRLLTEDLVQRLCGTLVALPLLSPVGIRTMRRSPHHLAGEDPNRLWPEDRPARAPDPDEAPPTSLETAYARLFDVMLESADYLIDFHNMQLPTLSFAIQDRVLYRPGPDEDANRREAEALAARTQAMLEAYGHTIIGEALAEKYLSRYLHRSTSGALLQRKRVPAFTAELGLGDFPDPAMVEAAVCGTRNVLRWAGMLDDAPEPITGIKVVRPPYRVRRCATPRMPIAGLVEHLVEAGDPLAVGTPVARIFDVWGRPLGEGVVRSEFEGFVMGRTRGIVYYPGDALLRCAIRDDAPLVAPYPER